MVRRDSGLLAVLLCFSELSGASGRTSQVLRGDLPALLSLLTSFIGNLCSIPGHGWGGNFLIRRNDWFTGVDVLDELVHLCNPLVVFL